MSNAINRFQYNKCVELGSITLKYLIPKLSPVLSVLALSSYILKPLGALKVFLFVLISDAKSLIM